MPDTAVREHLVSQLREVLPHDRYADLEVLSADQMESMIAMIRCLQAADAERRSEPRRSVIRRVQVIPAGDIDSKPQFGFQEDTSAFGARVVVAKPIEEGTRVRLIHARSTAEGVIRHCKYSGSSGWILGIAYDVSPKP